MIADADIQRAAEELVERHGNKVMAIAREHVAALSAAHDQLAVDVALRVLSAVETLLATERS